MASVEKTTNDITLQNVGVSDKQPRSNRHEDKLKPDSKSEATSKGGEVSCERSSLFLVKDSREYSKPDYQKFFRKGEFKGEVVGIRKPANESSKDVIVEVETRSEEEVVTSEDLKSKASIMMSDTTTITLSGPYLQEIMKVISFFMENNPFLEGRGLHVDDSTTNMITEIDNIEDEQEQKSVKVSGPFRLVGYLRKLIRQTLVRYIDVVDSPQGKSLLEIAKTVAEESDDPDGGSDLDQPELDKEMDSNSTLSSSKREGEGFHDSANSDRHKSSTGTSGDDPPHGIPVATQTDTTTQKATVLTGKKGFKVTISETVHGGNTSGGFHPNTSTDHQNSNVGTSVDDTSVAAQTDTTIPAAVVLTGKEVFKGAIPEATSKEPDVVEIPLSKTHRKLVVKEGHFLYEDVDIKIAAICSEMGFTEGLNKNLNDQMNGLLQQTVDRRYQKGKPDKFDVFTVHCPPSTIGCRYLVVANILDHTLGKQKDHHKFLQQILHSVFKEADTLEMPTVAIAMQSFDIGGFPADTILPSFVRILDQYQFTHDEFFSDVRVLAASAENFSSMVAVAERFLGKSLTSRHTSSKKTASDLPNSEDDKVHLSSQGMIDKDERKVVPPPTYASNLNPAVIHLMIKCRMISQFLTISSDFTRVDVLKGDERYLEDFSTSYQNLFNGQRILQERVELRETLLHDMPALLVSTLEAQFPQSVFDFNVGNNSVCFLSLDQSIWEAVDKTVQDFLSKKRTVPKEHPHTNGATEQSAITLSMPYNRSLTVKKGDLVKEEVTAIVNAANERLKHGAGVAHAINRASRGQVQRESDRVMRDNWQGCVPTGQVAVTGAGGDLRCKAVIHAVGPDASVMKMDYCKRLLKQACESTLRCAEDEGMHSIALPPISSGIYAMPKNLVAQILIDTIFQYPYRQDSSLKDIRIVIIDRLTFMPFFQYAQQKGDSSQFVSSKASTTSSSLASVPSRITEQPTITLPMPYNRSLTVKKGDLVKEDVTAIVNAANGWLKHEGGVAYVINQASRGQVQRESDHVISRNWQHPIPTGQVAVTGAGGDLRCKAVIHAVGPDARVMKMDDCKQLLKHVCENTLHCAEDEGMHSIALPPISSGIYAMPKDIVAQILIDTILQYPYKQNSSLMDVRIVIFDGETFQPFLHYAQKVPDSSPFVLSSNSKFPPSLAPTSSANQKSSSPPASSIPTSEVDVVEIPLGTTHRRLVLKKSHFVYEDADIKIAAICSEMGFTEGLNKNLNDQLKGQLQQTVDRRYQNGKPDKFDVFTVHCPPSTIGCRYLVVANILDRTLGKQKDQHKFLQQILHSVFKEADTLEMPSVAIAPTTFAIGGFPQDSILPSFIRMFNQYQFTNDEFLTDVRFIAASDVEFDQLLAVAERVSGTKLKVPLNVKPTEPEEQEQKSDQNQGSSFFSSLGSAVSVVTGLFSFVTNSTQGQPEVISIPLQADRRLTLKMGNLIEEDVDAIVNPANGHLKHGTGVASAINKASNGNVQRESDSLIDRRGGPISPGRVAVTAAGGKLHCKYIIHAVVPYSGLLSLEKYKEFLEEACKNTLSIAEQDKMLSIAFPPFISSLDKTSQRGPIAQIVIDAMLKYPYKHNSPLKDIRIVISDAETLQPFQQYMQQVADSSPSISSGASTSPQISTASPSSTMHPSAAIPSSTHQQPSSPHTSSSISTSKPEEVEIPFDKSHRKLIIKKGHFLYEDADIKIAAICSEMGFAKGLNKNLNDPLKDQLKQTVNRRYQNGKPDKFDVFTVHCSPSTIGCRYLVVANILDNTLGKQKDHHKFLQQILHSVFKEADTLEMPSVAIVPNTFAIGGFPRDTILPSFIRMFSQYQFTNDEFLTDVRFLATDDAGLATLCAAAERTVGRPPSSKQKSNPVTLAPKLASPPDQSPGYGSKVSKIPAATVITGDIAQYAADAIVVPVSPSLEMKGDTSKVVNSISKGAVLKYVSRLKGKISEGNVISVPCVKQWNIQSKYLYLLCRSQHATLEILSQACKNALETAKSHHLQSIAFPPITSHQKKGVLARAMMDVINDFSDENQGRLSVTIVVKKDDPIYKPFLQIMESTVAHWECKESAL